jgi:ribonuclease HI
VFLISSNHVIKDLVQEKVFKNILVFSDGACSGNPGPGGWAAVVATPDGQVRELGGYVEQTTNNRMELSAVIHALQALKKTSGPIYMYTDSTYVIRGITQWIWGWRKRGWVNAEGKEVLNRDLWEVLFSLVMDRGGEGKVHWHYSRGHSGTPGNERCDEIAVAYSLGKRIELYQGPLLKYSIAIYDLPENTDLPEMKPKEAKKVAYAYLSNIGGIVYRHWDWPSCERRVKGKSGAKFKKAMTAADEIKILEEWGVSPDAEIKE